MDRDLSTDNTPIPLSESDNAEIIKVLRDAFLSDEDADTSMASSESDNAEIIDVLRDAFLSNQDAYIKGKVSVDEEVYNIIGSPGPSQYRAFNGFFNLFEEKKEEILKADFLTWYETGAKVPMLQFLEDLGCSDVKDKDIILASGSFWGRHPDTRKEVIAQLERLHGEGANVQIHTQAQDDEEFMNTINPDIKAKSRFSLSKRIPIHFICVGDERSILDMVHTELTVYRLSLLLDHKKLLFKEGKTQADLLQYYRDVVSGAL